MKMSNARVSIGGVELTEAFDCDLTIGEATPPPQPLHDGLVILFDGAQYSAWVDRRRIEGVEFSCSHPDRTKVNVSFRNCSGACLVDLAARVSKGVFFEFPGGYRRFGKGDAAVELEDQ